MLKQRSKRQGGRRIRIQIDRAFGPYGAVWRTFPLIGMYPSLYLKP